MIQPVGYFKIWRELFTKPIWLNSTPEQKTILITLLGMANFRDNQWEWEGSKFVCKPGQFITSANSIIKNCGENVSRQNVRTSLKRFEKLNFLTYKSTKKGMLISIENWEIYQGNSECDNQVINQSLTITQPSPNQDLTTKEEGKNTKKTKKERKDIYTADFESFYSMYPNAFNKEQTFRNWNSCLKEDTKENILKALDNYLDEIESKNTEKQYIIRSTNFIGKAMKYKGYIDYEVDEEPPAINPWSSMDS